MTTVPKTSFIERAKKHWPAPMPDWVAALAEACDAQSQRTVAERLDYSASAISATIANKYTGDVQKISECVRGAFMSFKVECPRKGPMNRNTCLQWQDKPFAPTSADRVAMYRACRSGCPHSRLKEA